MLPAAPFTLCYLLHRRRDSGSEEHLPRSRDCPCPRGAQRSRNRGQYASDCTAVCSGCKAIVVISHTVVKNMHLISPSLWLPLSFLSFLPSNRQKRHLSFGFETWAQYFQKGFSPCLIYKRTLKSFNPIYFLIFFSPKKCLLQKFNTIDGP